MKKPFNDLYSDFFKDAPKKEKKPLKHEEMQNMMKDLDQLNTEMNQILNENLKKISEKTESLPTCQVMPNKDYIDVCEMVKTSVYHQDEAIEQLNIAFKRPYYISTSYQVKNTMLMTGPLGSGRHTLIETFCQCLYANNNLSSPRPTYIDMSKITDEATWILDMYSALQKKDTLIVFEHIDSCEAIYLEQLTTLFSQGKLPLKGRYIMQNKKLVSAEKMLDGNLVSHLEAKQHYFMVLSNKPMPKLKSQLGNRFLETIHGFIELKPLDVTTCLTLLKKDISLLENQMETSFKTHLFFDKSALTYLAKQGTKDGGYHQIKSLLTQISQALSDYLFQHQTNKITISYQDESLVINSDTSLLKQNDSNSELEAIQEEMDHIVGLTEVKQYILALKNMVNIAKKRKEAGLKSTEVSMHTIFTGNPGTGKTTMARLMAKYLKALGILKNGQLVEVTRADLVAQYVGQTAPKTKQVIEASLGGILFIDEAYSLYRGKEDSFGLEAIDMLVKGMEDYRDEFVVVLAGYTKEMQVFLEANSGLKSRFPNMIEFPDYTAEQLLLIAKDIAKNMDYEIDSHADEKLLAYFTQTQGNKSSGNGRLARNVVEEATLAHATRLTQNPNASLTLLEAEDFRLEEKNND